MEVVSADGSAIQVKPGQTRELGRSNGLNSSDKTISRRHVSFFMPQVTNDQEILLRFEVVGRNPIYVSKDDEVKIFRRFERGEMENGDMFCVSAKNPVWYTLRKIQNGEKSVRRNDTESELAENLESGVGFECAEDFQQEGVDISDLDPVKEFGFLVIGHEFDSYPTKMIRDIKNWDWVLEEARKDSNDDDDDSEGKKGKKIVRKKRKKGIENEDEEWTGESEDAKVLIGTSKKAQKAKYVTRSKDCGKKSKFTSKSTKSPIGNGKGEVDDEDDEEDDDEDVDETLGGFIVGDENLEDEEEIADEDEEEFVDEEEDEDE